MRARESGDTDIAYMREVRTISPATMKSGLSRNITEPGWIWMRSAVSERKKPNSCRTQTNWMRPRPTEVR